MCGTLGGILGGPPVISHFSGLFNGNFQDREFILLQAVIFVGTLGGNFGGFIFASFYRGIVVPKSLQGFFPKFIAGRRFF